MSRRILSVEEISTILAALRCWQHHRGEPISRMNDFLEIENNCGEIEEVLEDEDIDALCEDINCGTVVIE